MQIGLKGIAKILKAKGPSSLLGVIGCGLVSTTLFEGGKYIYNSFTVPEKEIESPPIPINTGVTLEESQARCRRLETDLTAERKLRLAGDQSNSNLEAKVESLESDAEFHGIEVTGLKQRIIRLGGDEDELFPIVNTGNTESFADWSLKKKASVPETLGSDPKKLLLPNTTEVEPILTEPLSLSIFGGTDMVTIKLLVLIMGWYFTFYPLIHYKLGIFFFGKKNKLS